MGDYLTQEIAAMLGITQPRVRWFLDHGKIKPPRRDASGRLRWSDDDIAALRKALAALRPYRQARRPAVAVAVAV